MKISTRFFKSSLDKSNKNEKDFFRKTFNLYIIYTIHQVIDETILNFSQSKQPMTFLAGNFKRCIHVFLFSSFTFKIELTCCLFSIFLTNVYSYYFYFRFFFSRTSLYIMCNDLFSSSFFSLYKL